MMSTRVGAAPSQNTSAALSRHRGSSTPRTAGGGAARGSPRPGDGSGAPQPERSQESRYRTRTRTCIALLTAAPIVLRLGVYAAAGNEPAARLSAPVDVCSAAALLALAAAVNLAPPAIARLAGPLAMVIVATLPLIFGCVAPGGIGAAAAGSTELQIRVLAAVGFFPCVYSISTAAFVAAASIPLCAAAVLAGVASFYGSATPGTYFFVLVIHVFALTSFLILRSRRSPEEARATARRLEEEGQTLHSLMIRRAWHACALGRECARVSRSAR
jgi:hypothetical protein